MANYCSIYVNIPLNKIPDDKEREGLTALYHAEKKWSEAVKLDDELRRGNKRDLYLASQPGVPFEKTKYTYHFSDEEVKKGFKKEGELRPEEEQWNKPTTYASFEERKGIIYVHPNTFGRGGSLLFDYEDGITLKILKTPKNKIFFPFVTNIPMSWDFKYSFPWWAQIGFAGGVKEYDKEAQDPPEGKSQEFYIKWIEEHGQPMPYLAWEQSAKKLIKNLEFAINVYENFPVIGNVWQMDWVWRELYQLRKIYRWVKQINFVSDEAIFELNWSEVAMYSGEYKWTKENDSPNQIMTSIKKMEKDSKSFLRGQISTEKFTKDHLFHLKKNEKDTNKSYTKTSERDPFYYLDWFESYY